MRKLVRDLYKRLVPQATRRTIAHYAKGVVAGSGALLQVVNLYVPDYSDEAKAAVGGVIAVLTFVGVVRKKNRSR